MPCPNPPALDVPRLGLFWLVALALSSAPLRGADRSTLDEARSVPSATRRSEAEAVPMASNVAERISELRALIAYHDDLYYRKAAPEISDAAYDSHKRELNGLEAANP